MGWFIYAFSYLYFIEVFVIFLRINLIYRAIPICLINKPKRKKNVSKRKKTQWTLFDRFCWIMTRAEPARSPQWRSCTWVRSRQSLRWRLSQDIGLAGLSLFFFDSHSQNIFHLGVEHGRVPFFSRNTPNFTWGGRNIPICGRDGQNMKWAPRPGSLLKVNLIFSRFFVQSLSRSKTIRRNSPFQLLMTNVSYLWN